MRQWVWRVLLLASAGVIAGSAWEQWPIGLTEVFGFVTGAAGNGGGGMTRFHTGVVIGKFSLPHRGHHSLIDTALAQCDHVAVLVCWKPEQTVPIAVRLACLREEHPAAEVMAVPDTLGDDDTAGWAAATLRLLGDAPDAVFTSEDYGDGSARQLGATRVSVDRQRLVVPCSGTMVRANPLACLSDGEHIRHGMPRRFAEELARTGRRWVLLRGAHAARMARATALIDALVA